MKLRLLLLEQCNRCCRGCCNKDFNLTSLPVCTDFSRFTSIMLTGGEPFLKPELILSTVNRIRLQTDAPIYIYTAYREDPELLCRVLNLVDGITLTLHTRKDVEPFKRLDQKMRELGGFGVKSLRLNMFQRLTLDKYEPLPHWKIKSNIKWIKNCPLPKDEVFMRI